jgi:outer membrane immunogenic protein
MKNVLRCGVAVAALAIGPAFAADMPARVTKAPVVAPPPMFYNWSGFYIGAHAGGGWGEKCFAFAGVGEGCHDVDGWLAGGQVGYNWQAGNLVLGVEFSGSFADKTGSHIIPGTLADTYSTRVDSIFMLTGRIGYAWDRVLLYATGGGASARERYNYFDAVGVTSASAREHRWGWTVGAGLEFALAPNWSIAAQYNYIDFGDRDRTFSGSFGTFSESIDQHVHLATVRLNYRFGGPVVARY